MHKKLLYSAPEAEILVVQSEAFICASGDMGIGGFVDDNDPLKMNLDPLDIDLNSLLGLPGGLTL